MQPYCRMSSGGELLCAVAHYRMLPCLSFHTPGIPFFCVQFVVLCFACVVLSHCPAPIPAQVHHDK